MKKELEKKEKNTEKSKWIIGGWLDCAFEMILTDIIIINLIRIIKEVNQTHFWILPICCYVILITNIANKIKIYNKLYVKESDQILFKTTLFLSFIPIIGFLSWFLFVIKLTISNYKIDDLKYTTKKSNIYLSFIIVDLIYIIFTFFLIGSMLDGSINNLFKTIESFDVVARALLIVWFYLFSILIRFFLLRIGKKKEIYSKRKYVFFIIVNCLPLINTIYAIVYLEKNYTIEPGETNLPLENVI
ncbi:hypothetical protein SCHIN_v1c06740 [Spiroplasma chinense]|uniref:Uncharacterized protein n=1 Tax=Spiroplasma chinense TaxID=216932 RepID=A0A5B9Y4A8_9MOLU|nr:hypothetical protein [Spiroplasma chinense]QEH61871.1 hypothetical protein SCHIN_v1c06740 [Spiroplasma chinense]